MNYKKLFLTGLLAVTVGTQAVAPATQGEAKKDKKAPARYAAGVVLGSLGIISGVATAILNAKDISKYWILARTTAEKSERIARTPYMIGMPILFTYFSVQFAKHCAKKFNEATSSQEKKQPATQESSC